MSNATLPGIAGFALATALNTTPATDAENAAYLPALTSECERLGLTLQLTNDPAFDLPEIRTINGQRTVLARADELGVALDDLRWIGLCIDCKSELDDTALPYADDHNHVDGTPVMICRSCQDRRAALLAEPSRQAFSRALDMIEAAFKASKNPEQTRQALRTFVDMTAAEFAEAGR